MTDHNREGWYNFCRQCNYQYWVRAVDVSMPKMRRFVSRESTEKHQCVEVKG